MRNNALAITFLLGLQNPWAQSFVFATNKNNGAFQSSNNNNLVNDVNVNSDSNGVCRAVSSSGVCEDNATSSNAVSAANLALLTPRGRTVLERLMTDGGQSHVYSHWPEAGVQDELKIRLAEQVRLCISMDLLHECVESCRIGNFCFRQFSF